MRRHGDGEVKVRPDYLSSSRKRLAPQLIFKGGIINAWSKKTAVALNKGFFNTLPKLPEVPKEKADTITIIVAVTIAGGIAISRAEDPSPKYTVEQIMKAVFKGEDSVAKKIGKGSGSQADFDKLVEYVSSLPLNDAPQGDPAGWKKKTMALLAAATALKAGKPDALA